MNIKKLNLLALHAINLAEKGEDVSLKLTDEEAEYFLRMLDRTDITWATGDKPSKFAYYSYGKGRILWITSGGDFLNRRMLLGYSDPRDFTIQAKPLRPSDMTEPNNFRRSV